MRKGEGVDIDAEEKKRGVKEENRENKAVKVEDISRTEIRCVNSD